MTTDVIVREDGTDEFLAEAALAARLALIREEQAQAQRAAVMGAGASDAPTLASPMPMPVSA